MPSGRDCEVDYFGEILYLTPEEKMGVQRFQQSVAQHQLAPRDADQKKIEADFEFALRYTSSPARQPKPIKPMAEKLREMTRKKLGLPDSMDNQIRFATAVHSSFDNIYKADGFISLDDTAYLLDVTVDSKKAPEHGKEFLEYKIVKKDGTEHEVLIIPEIDEPAKDLDRLLNIYTEAIAVGLFLESKKEKRKELWQKMLPLEIKAAIIRRVFELYGEKDEKFKEIMELTNEQEKSEMLRSNQNLKSEAEKHIVTELGKEKALAIMRENPKLAIRCKNYNLGYDVPIVETRIERTVIRRRGVDIPPR